MSNDGESRELNCEMCYHTNILLGLLEIATKCFSKPPSISQLSAHVQLGNVLAIRSSYMFTIPK